MEIAVKDRQRVDGLLQMYQQYKMVSEHQANASRSLAKAKLKQQPTHEQQSEYDAFTVALQAIADAMTFASPLIWAVYKFEAYAQESQPIRTMHDFRLHCSKPGYICTKRFNFVNQQLAQRGKTTLADSKHYPDEVSLELAFPILAELANDAAFMHAWEQYEYYTQAGRVAKWENFE